MKTTLFSVVLLYLSTVSIAQISVNTSGNSPHPSAAVDVDFNNKGFLPPRMTTTERNAIVSPAEGLQVFNTTTKCLEYYVNNLWQPISCACSVPTVSTTSPASRCGTGTVAIGATASAGVINWYDVPTGGNLLGVGGSFTTPSIAASTTYYAEAVNGSCISVARTAVIATVNAYPSVAAITGTAAVDVGSTTQLSNATPGGTWSSSNTSLATVSITGLVTGMGAGSLTITYSVTSDGCTTDVTLVVTVSVADPCAAAGGMMYGGYCWLPTGVGISNAEISCATFCSNLGKTCNSSVMQAISQSQASDIVHLFHPGVTMTSSGDAPSYQWPTGTGNYYVESGTCTHNDNSTGRERYCVCSPEP